MDAEKLFIAMGYKLLPNQTLVLDGPICPDQVTNVSRDALTAYVECQIMKQINAELATQGVATSWMEIFNFRECHIGDSSQSIKGLSQILQSHHNHIMRKGNLPSLFKIDQLICFKLLLDFLLISLLFLRPILDPFAISARPLPTASSSHPYQQQHQTQPMCSSHCSVHPYNHNQAPPPNSFYNPAAYAQPCSLHMQNSFVPPNGFYQPQHNLPHSKSLDQYDGKMPPNGNGNVHHRLSLDHNYKINQHLSPSQQPPTIAPFDCIDSIAFNHPYNQPNARSPLPYNLSSNLGQHMQQQQQQEQYYPPPDPMSRFTQHPPRQFYGAGDFHNHQLPTPVLDYKMYEFSDSSSPAMPENELISFGNEHTSRLKPGEVKLRSSLKKNIPSSSELLEFEHELNELRALKRIKSVTPSSTSSDKARDGIGNYQSWDYVYNNLEKETSTKNMVGNHDDKVAAELQLENLKITSNGHGPPKLHPKSNGVPHRMSDTTARSSSGHNHNSSIQTKSRTKSVSTATEMSNHEHKRTSSVLETSSRSNNSTLKHKPPVQPQIVVPSGQWSCRFCTFLNPDEKKICEMCSKSKDFFLDADKNPATATCV